MIPPTYSIGSVTRFSGTDMGTQDELTRFEIEQLPLHARIALVAQIVRRVLNNFLENLAEIEPKYNKLFERLEVILEGLASGSLQANLTLANDVWNLAFDISVGVKVAATSGDDELLQAFEAIHACGTYLYDTILALQTHNVPQKMYLARGVDGVLKAIRSIRRTDSQASRRTIPEIGDDYQRISTFSTSRSAPEEVTIPVAIIRGSEKQPVLLESQSSPKRKIKFTLTALQPAQI